MLKRLDATCKKATNDTAPAHCRAGNSCIVRGFFCLSLLFFCSIPKGLFAPRFHPFGFASAERRNMRQNAIPIEKHEKHAAAKNQACTSLGRLPLNRKPKKIMTTPAKAAGISQNNRYCGKAAAPVSVTMALNNHPVTCAPMNMPIP